MIYIFMGLLVLITSCGSSSPGHGNSFDSQKSQKFEKPSKTTEATDKAKQCLYDCTTEPVARLDFQAKALVLWPHCKVKDFRSIQTPEGFLVFALANCFEGYQIFEFMISADGIMSGEPRVVSSECYAYFHEVMLMEMAYDGENGLLVYYCDQSLKASSWTRDYGIKARKISSNRTVGPAVSLFTLQVSESTLASYVPFLSYNAKSQTYGLLMKDDFQRLNQNGEKIGGRVYLKLKYATDSMTAYQGNWFIYSQGSISSSAYCSKVSGIGILECDKVALNEKNVLLGQNGKLISTNQTYSMSDLRFSISSFKPDTCVASKPIPLGEVYVDGKSQYFSLFDIMGNNMGILYHDSRAATLKIAIVRSEFTGKVLADVSIANISKPKRVDVLKTDRELMVMYLVDEVIHLTWSPITVD